MNGELYAVKVASWGALVGSRRLDVWARVTEESNGFAVFLRAEVDRDSPSLGEREAARVFSQGPVAWYGWRDAAITAAADMRGALPESVYAAVRAALGDGWAAVPVFGGA